MRFEALGRLAVTDDAGRPYGMGSLRQRQLLAVLLCRPGRSASNEMLLDALWGGRPPPSAWQNLRTYVYRVRQTIGRDRIRYAAPDYTLAVRPGEVDVDRFEEMAARGRRAWADGDAGAAADQLAAALGCWRGEPYSGLDDGIDEPPAPVRIESTRLTELRLTVLEDRLAADLVLGRHHDLVPELTTLVEAHPLRERLRGQLMLALHRSGRTSEALSVFRTGRRMLVEELGIDPGPELCDIEREILAGGPAPEQVPVTAGGSASGAGKSPAGTGIRPGGRAPGWWGQCQLPGDIIDFTGRRTELRALDDLLRRPPDQSPTICVLHGMGGVGKTRLAVHAAHRHLHADRYPDGQLYVDLRGVTADQQPADPSDVLESFLRQLGVPGQLIPGDPGARSAMFRSNLVERRVLVLLDNAATEDQVLPLLPAGRHCAVLVTSRRNLSLEGAVSLHVDVFPEADAVEFLAVNAGGARVAAEPDAAAEIVRLCGHLPIAVALAAHRLRARPAWQLRDLLARMRNRHRILDELVAGSRAVQDVVDLSYRALSPAQQRVFRLLGAHPGTDATARSMAAAADLDARTAEDLLESLLDEHLLVQTTPDRYRMHDLVRAYARHLVDTREPAERRSVTLGRLLRYYRRTATLARQALDPHLHPVFEPPGDDGDATGTFHDRDDALRWFHAERAAMVAAIHAGADSGEDRVTWQLSAVLLSFFYLSKHWDDWLDTHRVGLLAAERVGDLAGQARLQMGLGVAYDDLGRFDDAVAHHETAAARFRRTSDRRGEAWNLNNLGVVYDNLGRFPEAADRYQAALELFRDLGDPKGQGLCLNNLGDVHRQQGRHDRAEDCLRRALDAQRGCADREAQRITFGTFGDLYRDLGRTAQAAAAYRDALEICVEFDDRWRADQLRRHLKALDAGENDASP